MNFKELTSIQYWITIYPGPVSMKTIIIFAVIFCGLIIASITLGLYIRSKKKVLDKPHKKFYYKIKSFGSTMGIVGLCWLFFAYEMIPILSARFWFLIWFVGAAVWVYTLAYYAQAQLKKGLEEIRLREQRNKYL